eukprot:TRINITY_DN1303_c0_g2_i2.p2 TRINITY_DN1303_c0_g2~~TRINITY_DN1303_c0_g2_i2.p2  ORF type:complete len:129 (+),score=18.17 TRINITY_DN1303_c0_g2_i2:1717-2103(+)
MKILDEEKERPRDIAWFIHTKQTTQDFDFFFSCINNKVDIFRDSSLFVTDGDKALRKSISRCFLLSTSTLCYTHTKRAAKQSLKEVFDNSGFSHLSPEEKKKGKKYLNKSLVRQTRPHNHVFCIIGIS